MEETINSLPENIKVHLRSITKTTELPDTEESFNKIAINWIKKKSMFEDQIKSLDMEEVDNLSKDDRKAALLLTYSGSLISMGCKRDAGRWIEYVSIKLRKDVPDVVPVSQTNLAGDIRIDKEVEFMSGPIKKTSSLLKIAICRGDVNDIEQEKRIREAAIFLTNGFTKTNRITFIKSGEVPEHITRKSILRYLASKHSLTQKLMGQIIEDYHLLLESGLLLGDRVPLGSIGKIFIKKRAAQKARVITNPATGEKMTVQAKPEMYVPKIVFSKGIKEKAKLLKLETFELKDDESGE